MCFLLISCPVLRQHCQAMAIAIPSEITAAQIILTFWDENKNHAPIYTAAMCLAVCVINTFGVRWFGECKHICIYTFHERVAKFNELLYSQSNFAFRC